MRTFHATGYPYETVNSPTLSSVSARVCMGMFVSRQSIPQAVLVHSPVFRRGFKLFSALSHILLADNLYLHGDCVRDIVEVSVSSHCHVHVQKIFWDPVGLNSAPIDLTLDWCRSILNPCTRERQSR